MTAMHPAVIRSCPSFDARLLLRNVTRAKDFDTKRSVAYIKDKQGMTALHIAARKGHVEVMKELMEECSDIGEILDNKDRTALHIAAEHNCHSVVRTLLNERGFTDLINEQDNEGNTALHVAAIHGHYEIMKRLVVPRLQKYGVIHFTKSDSRLANNGIPLELQKLRCCSKGCNTNEIEELTKLRYAYPWWKQKEIDSVKKRKMGECPLTPEETALTLRALDIDPAMQIYIVAGNIYEFMVGLKLWLTKNKDPLLSLQDTGFGMVKSSTTKKETTRDSTQIQMRTQSGGPNIKQDNNNNGQDVQYMQNMNLVVSTLIAGITFQAAITMPFAAAPYKTTKGLEAFKAFMAVDSLVFGFSAGSLLIHFMFAMLSMIFERKFRGIVAREKRVE
ncbi:hypothetical protein G4B88_009140 [Cannabis sativa]|uniref:PGG domain-containing protein n=1 Tax=Cannabis sativa TaxID=3483 RepID=A0A7J6DMT8_CANSA|nr:hypothetical protein G4B88_009140 [Cannabis sativa]